MRKYQTAVSFRPRESVLKVDRKFSGSRRAIIHQRRSLVNSTNGELKMRVILDRFSAEVFVNDGEQVTDSDHVYGPVGGRDLLLRGRNGEYGRGEI